MNNRKYYRYQMTFPFEGSKIYKSRSINKIVNKCYREYKNHSDINDGMFCVTNLDKDIEYKFRVTENKIKNLKGGSGEDNDNDNDENNDNDNEPTIGVVDKKVDLVINKLKDQNGKIVKLLDHLENIDKEINKIKITKQVQRIELGDSCDDKYQVIRPYEKRDDDNCAIM